MRSNNIITVKGHWQEFTNILETNCGMFAIKNFRMWYDNPESYFTIKIVDNKYWIRSCIPVTK